MQHRMLVFGGRGALGTAVRARHVALGWAVTATSRQAGPFSDTDQTSWIRMEAGAGVAEIDALCDDGPYSAVCWAQGANINDSVFDVDLESHIDLYGANCLFVLETLRLLLDQKLLADAARLVVVSSIWQRIARPQKLSYMMTKAALGGLVQSASVDLAERGILINAVLPSALDTPMTTKNLTPVQVAKLADATGFGRLTSVEDVVAVIEFLCSEKNTGVTGQSIAVDLGFSHARAI